MSLHQQVSLLRIVVASPSDVQGERDALPELIAEINRSVAADRNLRLELSRWETDTYPGFHAKGPQGGIDPILKIEDCDLLLGIFWRRFGTPTSDAGSGTEHEFKLAYQTWQKKGRPQIMVYFNQKSHTPQSKEETDQWGKVLEFRNTFPKEGLWWPYKGKIQFISLVRNHLTQYVRNLKLKDGGEKLSVSAPQQPQTHFEPELKAPSGDSSSSLHDLSALSIEEKRELVQTLGRCASMSNPSTRDSIIQELDSQIANAIPRHAQNNVDVFNIVDTCLRYRGGLAALIEAVRFFEQGTQQIEAVDILLKKILRT